MSLLLLASEDLLTISRAWLESPLRDDFERLPEVSGMLPMVEEVHSALAEIVDDQGSPRGLEEATRQADVVDARHDAAVRTIWKRLIAQESYYLSIDPVDAESARAIARVRERLLPDGLKVIEMPYWKEAVFASEIQEKLDVPTRQILERIPVTSDVTLLDVAKQWGQLGRVLGNLESAKVASVMKRRKNWKGARQDWLEVAQSLHTLLSQVRSDIDAAKRLQQPVFDALQQG